ncbi:MFS transporter [Brevibacillus massiliensis]|uniref:MFS transporter n=1 Tax=Brevibacillus massiliensis TaxID=1118054 RepID=UPI000372B660|nr:MFS transporter [Brevibacillus massiliensis]
MESWKRNLIVLWLGVFLSNASYTMVVPFLSLYLFDLGVGKQTVNLWSGIIFSAAFFVGAIMAPYWGARADQTGKRRMVIRAGISLTVVYLLASFVRNPWELLAVRMLQGFVSGFVPASMAIVASSVPQNKMGWSLGIMQTAGATGGILGPLFGGLLSEFFGMRLAFVVSSVVILLATVAVWLFVKEEKIVPSQVKHRVIEDIRAAWHNRILMKMLALLFIVQLVYMVLQPLLTLYVTQLQGQVEGAVLSSGIIFSLSGIAGIIAAPYWGKIGQQKGFFNILYIALIGAGIMNAAQFLSNNLWTFGGVQFVFGLFISGVLPAVNTIVVEHTDADFRGRAFGLTTSANQLGSMVGPILGGLLGSLAGIRFVFVCTGTMLVIVGLIVWKYLAKRKLPAAPYQDSFH